MSLNQSFVAIFEKLRKQDSLFQLGYINQTGEHRTNTRSQLSQPGRRLATPPVTHLRLFPSGYLRQFQLSEHLVYPTQ